MALIHKPLFVIHSLVQKAIVIDELFVVNLANIITF